MMANNLHVNKVSYGGRTLIDLTEDTISSSDVLNGVTFHDRSGAPQTGGLIVNSVYDDLDSTSSTDALSANQGKLLNDKINTLNTNFTLNPYKEWSTFIDITAIRNNNLVSVSGYAQLDTITYDDDRPVFVINGAAPIVSNIYLFDNEGTAYRILARNNRTEIIFHASTTISSAKTVFFNFTYIAA